MKNREKILMQKIAKREKIKKKLNAKAPKAETAEVQGENILTFSKVLADLLLAAPLAPSPPKSKKAQIGKFVGNPDKKDKKKKRKQPKAVKEPESDEPMEQESDDEPTNGAEEAQCKFVTAKLNSRVINNSF